MLAGPYEICGASVIVLAVRIIPNRREMRGLVIVVTQTGLYWEINYWDTKCLTLPALWVLINCYFPDDIFSCWGFDWGKLSLLYYYFNETSWWQSKLSLKPDPTTTTRKYLCLVWRSNLYWNLANSANFPYFRMEGIYILLLYAVTWEFLAVFWLVRWSGLSN